MLSLEKLSFSYPNGLEIFKDLTITFPKKGLVHLQGSNGSGKTTLFRILSHLIKLKDGQMKFNSTNFSKEMVSFMPSDPNSSFFNLTGKETIMLFNRLNLERKDNIPFEDILKPHPIFNEALNTEFYKNSTGMKQIINLLRTLTKKTDVYILDEPLNGIDKAGKSLIYEILDELKKDHLVIMSSHENLDLNFTNRFLLKNNDIKEIT